MSTFANTTFAVVSDVLNYINSSEIVLARGKADNTPIAFTADATTNLFTTSISHNFLNLDSVEFVNTGGALPAPLAAGTDYWVIYVSQTTFKVSTIKGGAALDLTTAGTGVNTVRNTTIEKVVQAKLTLGKSEVLKWDLIKEARKRFSTTISDFTNEMYSAIDDAKAKNGRAINQSEINDVLPAYWNDFFSSLSYSPLGYFSDQVSIDTNIFCNFGIPDSSVKKKAGAIVINTDTSQNQFPYVNQGTQNSPNWVRFQPKNLIDFISNPDCLKMCHVFCTLMLMARDGMFSNRVNFQERTNYEFQLDGERLFALLYDEEKYGKLSPDQKKRISEGNFNLIEWDIAGNGIINDYSLSKTNEGRGAMIW